MKNIAKNQLIINEIISKFTLANQLIQSIGKFCLKADETEAFDSIMQLGSIYESIKNENVSMYTSADMSSNDDLVVIDTRLSPHSVLSSIATILAKSVELSPDISLFKNVCKSRLLLEKDEFYQYLVDAIAKMANKTLVCSKEVTRFQQEAYSIMAEFDYTSESVTAEWPLKMVTNFRIIADAVSKYLVNRIEVYPCNACDFTDVCDHDLTKCEIVKKRNIKKVKKEKNNPIAGITISEAGIPDYYKMMDKVWDKSNNNQREYFYKLIDKIAAKAIDDGCGKYRVDRMLCNTRVSLDQVWKDDKEEYKMSSLAKSHIYIAIFVDYIRHLYAEKVRK